MPEDWCRGFFGKHYMAGDRSTRGYLPGRRESLSQRTSREVAGVIRLLDLAPSVRVADIPCGYGRHSLALAKLGYRVTGVDIDERELSEARRAAKEQDLQVDFLKADMRDIGLNYGGKFDAVINLFFAFGFFLEERENIRAMVEFYRVLKPDGRLLIHSDVCTDMLVRGRAYRFSETRALEGGGKLRIGETFDRQSSRLKGTWTITGRAGADRTPRPYSMRIYRAEEYAEMARNCGFRQVSIYGSFQGASFTPDSPEIIVVAKK